MGTKNPRKSRSKITIDPQVVYCCDSDSLINLRDAKLLRKLRFLARIDTLKIPRGVYRELHRKTDRLAQTLKKWKDKYPIVIELDYKSLQLLTYLEREYGRSFSVGGKHYKGFWASSSGRKSVDAQVIALAKTNKWVAVSNDDSIHGACMLEGVICRRWEEVGRILLGPEQLKLPGFELSK